MLLKLSEEERRVVAVLESLWQLRDSDSVFIDCIGRMLGGIESVERIEDMLHGVLKELHARRREFDGV